MEKSNFSFFSGKWSVLAKLGELAEKNLYTDPHTSLLKTRLFGEMISKSILAFENIPEHINKQYERINLLRRNDIMNEELINMFESLRRVGNVAAHDYHENESEALTALRFAHRIGVWFMEVYVDYSFQAPTFAVPQRKEENVDLEKLNQVYEEKLEKLEQELEGLRIEQKQRSELDIKLLKDKRKSTTSRYLNQLNYTESETRVLIDKQLTKAGWDVDSQNIRYSRGSRPEKGKNKAIAEWPCGDGIADYALFVGLELVGLVEAKRTNKDVMSDIEQAKKYARDVKKKGNEILHGPYGEFHVPFLFATNGRPYIKQLEQKSGIWMLDARKSTNHSKPLQAWYSPQGLHKLLEQDIEKSTEDLRNETLSYLKLRPYQEKAILDVEKAIERNQRQILVAMATGTGKTRMALGLIYRLIKLKRFKRVLFLVDREALGQQAEDVFSDSRLENFQTFTEIFDLQSLKGNKIPDEVTKVQIATVQGMVKRLFYQEDSVPTVDQYDCIIVDEAHRGYSLDREMSDFELEYRDHQDYISKYRKVIEYFDAVKIGLTATPALHTVEIFGKAVSTYTYREAVVDGFLVDHEPPFQFHTELKKMGISWKIGEEVSVYQAVTGTVEKEVLADDVQIDVTGFNRKVITENFNRVILKNLSEHLDPYAEGKTIIFAATDDHADMIVRILKEEMSECHGPIDDSLIMKITGSIHNPSDMIKRFKNEKLPKIAVTVDLLSTGIDVPEISNIVFLRRIRSRILYEQMLGRATRLCPEINKTHFKIYDAVGLYESLKSYSSIRPVVVNPTVSVQKLFEDLKTFKGTNLEKDRKEALVAKIQRKKQHWNDQDFNDFQVLNDGQSLEEFIGWLKETRGKQIVRKLKDKEELLKYMDAKRERPSTQYISTHEDRLIEVTRGYGAAEKPDDYLESFHKFLNENMNLIPAIQVICTRPKELTRSELRKLALELDQKGFTEKNLQTAWYHSTNEEIAADIISFIRRYAIGDALVSKQERIKRAMKKIYNRKVWAPLQKGWLEKIESQLLSNTILDPDPEKAFEAQPFKNRGGYKQINKIFKGELKSILNQINDELYKKEQA